jgi:dihydropteroate synthase
MLVRKAVINNFHDALELVRNSGCSKIVVEKLAKKAVFNAIILEDIDNRALNILKQEAISVGADIAVGESVSRFVMGCSNAVLFAALNQLEKLAEKLKLQPFSLKEVSLKIRELMTPKKFFRYGNKKIDLTNPVIMGIINMTPDSFSGDGITDTDIAVKKAVEFEKQGAKIIDIGAESSRPGAKYVDAKEEIKRLIPALKKIRKKIKIPISIDTYKYETAKAAIDEGADIINDIFALRKGREKLAKLISRNKSGLILMHMKGSPKNMQVNPIYKNCVSEIYKFLEERKLFAESFGINEEFIAVDPGPGFGKTIQNNMELLKNISAFSSLGAVVGAVSRKRFVREISGENICSFVCANFLTALYGADIIRTHDVKETASVLKLLKHL